MVLVPSIVNDFNIQRECLKLAALRRSRHTTFYAVGLTHPDRKSAEAFVRSFLLGYRNGLALTVRGQIRPGRDRWGN